MCCGTVQDDRERDDSSRLRSGLITNVGSGSGADSGTITSSDIVQRRPNRMLETWIICELCNAGNLQDAVLLHDHSVFFEGDIPQMVSSSSSSKGQPWLHLCVFYVCSAPSGRCATSTNCWAITFMSSRHTWSPKPHSMQQMLGAEGRV